MIILYTLGLCLVLQAMMQLWKVEILNQKGKPAIIRFGVQEYCL